MTRFRSTFLFSAALSLLAPITAYAEVLSTTNPTIRSFLCVGPGCIDPENPQGDELRLKGNSVRLHFEDDSDVAGLPTNDWRIVINDTFGGGESYFSINDASAGLTPFRVDAGAPTNALKVNAAGNLGLGTALPQQNLHIVGSGEAGIRFEEFSGGAFAWELRGNSAGFYLFDPQSSGIPFEVRGGAPNGAFLIDSVGFTGIGTRNPEEKLHIVTTTPNTDSFALFDAQGPGSDSAFRIRQNGLIPTTWEFRNQQTSGRLNVGIAGGNTPFKIDNLAANNLLRLGRNGRPDEVVVTGTLVVNNTDMNVPDYVFEPGYDLPTLAEVDAFIADNGHLPGVPSAAEVAESGLDMTRMQMAQLEKIEELTLHVIDLGKANAEQRDRIALLEGMIEALLADR
ncbi:hypothetical protein BOO69_03295 [Sulfitobacter alexandrii]|uniref:Tail fiber domain-containing protein n=1 Tax=Sulfitobacter alexandrii TaxID=1917485 RepID=A0A1J0WEH0_9RHOB|nr:hypothetical protein [Sulfitobacter alexandrii]APE42550.1 hypothetical protein BOO69_03295 [Sulfitobacter alexandrii]